MPDPREIYTPELAIKTCEQIALGKSLRTIAAIDGLPGITTIYKWIRDIPEFAEQYARAKSDAADTFIEDMLSISDDAENDYVTRVNEQGKEFTALDQEHIQRSRLRVDTRKWIASKLKPKVYGERLETRLTGADGESLVFRVEDARVPLPPLKVKP